MFSKLRLEAREPLRVSKAEIGKELAAGAHRRLIAIAMLRVAGIKRKDKPVEEAPPVPRGLDEQPVHRRGQPEHREPIAERGGGGSAPVDPDKPAARMRRLNAGAKRDRGEPLAREDLGKDCKTAARAVTHHLGERRAPEPAPGREKRNC